MLNSSCVEPSITGTWLNCPVSSAAPIDRGSTLPSTFGRIAPAVVGWTASRLPSGTDRRQADVWLREQPMFSATELPLCSALASDGWSSEYAPLWEIARLNSPAAAGDAS